MTLPSRSRTPSKRLGYIRLPVDVFRLLTDPDKMQGLHAIAHTVYEYLLQETFQQNAEADPGMQDPVFALPAAGSAGLCSRLSDMYRWPADRIKTALTILQKHGLIRIHSRHIELPEYEDHMTSETPQAKRMRRMRRHQKAQEAAAGKTGSIRKRKKEIDETLESAGVSPAAAPATPAAPAAPSIRDMTPEMAAKQTGNMLPQNKKPQAARSRPQLVQTGQKKRPANAETGTFSMKDLGI